MLNSSTSFTESFVSSTAWLKCLMSEPNSSIFTALTIAKIFVVLPLCVLVLHYGVQRWQRQRSSSIATTMSHSDVFTYHMVTMELINVFGSVLCCYGIYKNIFSLLIVCDHLYSFACYGKTFFHIFTCVEHYLAVVHPITYLSMRKESRIRNIGIGVIWLLCFGEMCLISLEDCSLILDMCFLSGSLIVISFCSISVLCVLVQSRPGEGGSNRERADQSKRRAFYTIGVILVVLLLRCGWDLVWTLQPLFDDETNDCVWLSGVTLSSFPSSLVLPLLFLHRAGTLVCCNIIK